MYFEYTITFCCVSVAWISIIRNQNQLIINLDAVLLQNWHSPISMSNMKWIVFLNTVYVNLECKHIHIHKYDKGTDLKASAAGPGPQLLGPHLIRSAFFVIINAY